MEFDKFSGDGARLAQELLAELPGQLLEYMKWVGEGGGWGRGLGQGRHVLSVKGANGRQLVFPVHSPAMCNAYTDSSPKVSWLCLWLRVSDVPVTRYAAG